MSGGVATLSGGVKFEGEYQRSVFEKPGTESIAYVSTVYNGLMRQMDIKDNEKTERNHAYDMAQKERLSYIKKCKQNNPTNFEQNKETIESQAADKETAVINEYWNLYAKKNIENRTAYYTNDPWSKYREANKGALEKMFENFLTPIIKAYKDHKETNGNNSENHLEWGDISELKFINAAQAETFLGRNPELALTDTDNGFGCADVESISVERKSKELDLFERFVLFNLYKEHQKHEFDYFYYKKE